MLINVSIILNGFKIHSRARAFFASEETQSDVGAQANGDPKLLDDSEFYQQLLKEFFETIEPASPG
ncbi:hypothetical protein C1H46_020356 [Malus baccata]|uniref:Uncharacterized protein n=1 Tax=Malus baccata TaxID=106549 RepID=A0A540M5J1_MALBA|nr:hypothetical protein C1H46_020356 [Malus baccata]